MYQAEQCNICKKYCLCLSVRYVSLNICSKKTAELAANTMTDEVMIKCNVQEKGVALRHSRTMNFALLTA